MRIVLDSNILLAAVGKKSRHRPIWTAFVNGRYDLIVSDDVIYEYEEILQLHSAPGVSELVMNIFIESSKIIFQKVYYLWNAIRQDPDDNKFFDIAVAGNADYLVTNDAHFNIVKQLPFPVVKVISGDDFLEILNLI